MERIGCHNCEHEYMNHRRCDLPFGVICNSGEKWEKRKDILSVFKDLEKLNYPDVKDDTSI